MDHPQWGLLLSGRNFKVLVYEDIGKQGLKLRNKTEHKTNV